MNHILREKLLEIRVFLVFAEIKRTQLQQEVALQAGVLLLVVFPNVLGDARVGGSEGL